LYGNAVTTPLPHVTSAFRSWAFGLVQPVAMDVLNGGYTS
jgi:hypothetical protein